MTPPRRRWAVAVEFPHAKFARCVRKFARCVSCSAWGNVTGFVLEDHGLPVVCGDWVELGLEKVAGHCFTQSTHGFPVVCGDWVELGLEKVWS